MLKRPVKVPLFMAPWSNNKSAAVGAPQPINEADKQRLVKLSDPQLSDDLPTPLNRAGEDAMSEDTKIAEETTLIGCSADESSKMPASGDTQVSTDAGRVGTEEVSMQPVQQQFFSRGSTQQRLRQVERRLRSSLNLSTIFGSTVVESAALFGARQVSLLRNVPGEQRWEQVAQFCENQALAWRQAFSIPHAEFPGFAQCLRREQILRLQTNQTPFPIAMPLKRAIALADSASVAATAEANPSNAAISSQLSTEKSQWLACWSGSWLLVPIQQSRTAPYGLNDSASSLPRSSWEGSSSSALNGSGLKQEAETAGPRAADKRHPSANTADMGAEANSENEPWGFIALAFDEQANWSDGAIAAVSSIALELELAMAQANQYQDLVIANQELQKLALSDGLTCLANRRRFDEHLADEWQRLARDKQPLSLILCDLDHFKRYNDSFGHPAGDRCLIRVARALLNGPQRPADLVARYGGEEFAIILPNTDTHGAWRIAKKIHESIRSLKIVHAPDNEEPYVTVTMGVSTVIPGHDTTPQMLVQASDLALYHAKQQGRNRTYVHAYYNTVDPDEVPQPESENESQPKMTPADEGEGGQP
ncbi:MAG: diguanylate cyclase [Cyanobacteria bacterium J06598_3]